jgi:YidC/Oxa1 family membrane protein insertase
VQIPVFSALYGIFNHAFDMRGATFLWIRDLSQPDRLYELPFWPHAINLLPILYIGLSFIQTRMTPQAPKSDDPQAEMNRKMMMFMPLMISLMFYNMPAGLVLYFTASACWGMLESWFIKKFVIKAPPPDGTASPAKPALAR